MDAIASTIGGALGKTHGSCLPLASKIIGFPIKSHVSYGLPIVDTGLNGTRKYFYLLKNYYVFSVRNSC